MLLVERVPTLAPTNFGGGGQGQSRMNARATGGGGGGCFLPPRTPRLRPGCGPRTDGGLSQPFIIIHYTEYTYHYYYYYHLHVTTTTSLYTFFPAIWGNNNGEREEEGGVWAPKTISPGEEGHYYVLVRSTGRLIPPPIMMPKMPRHMR